MINFSCVRSKFPRAIGYVFFAQAVFSFVALGFTISHGIKALLGLPFPVFSYILFSTGALFEDQGLKFHPVALLLDILILLVTATTLAIVLCRAHSPNQAVQRTPSPGAADL
jgi:hypothetical protein